MDINVTPSGATRPAGSNPPGTSVAGGNAGSISVNVGRTIENIAGRAAATAVDALKNMLAGDTFTAEIVSVDGTNIVLRMDNGMNLQASLLNNLNLTPGQNLIFMVNENLDNKISIKPMSLNEQEAVLVNRALDASGLPADKNNIVMVSELLKHGMSIDSESLIEFSKYIKKFPDVPIDTIIRLGKLDIPVTKENIMQFEAYKSYEHNISGELDSLSKSLGAMLSDISAKASASTATDLFSKIMSVLYPVAEEPGMATTTQNTPMAPADALPESDAALNSTENKSNTSLIQTESKMLPETIGKYLGADSGKNLAEIVRNTFGSNIPEEFINKLASGDITAKEVMEKIIGMINSDTSQEAVSKMFKSEGFEELARMVIRERLRINPEDVRSADSIKEYFSRVREDVSQISEAVKQAGKDSAFTSSLDNLRNNIEFMNDLNRNMSYFQVPVKFSQGDGNGELYVFTNKKSMPADPENLSALLHLDMENLGKVDVFIKLTHGNNVNTNFCLESEDMLDFVYSHIDELNTRLEKLGYNMKFEMKVRTPDDEINFTEDFLDNNQKLAVPEKYLFDTRA